MDLNVITQLYNFSGKTVVITGGTGILGGEMACALVGCGANVAVLDRNPAIPEIYRQPMEAGPGKYLVVYADVLDHQSLHDAKEEINKHFGHVDSLINAAGGNHPDATTSPDRSFFEISQAAIQWVIDLNLKGTILSSQVFCTDMIAKGSGEVLNITSMAASQPLTRVAAYSAAKAAVSNFTQWLAVHMAQEYSPNIRVNAIAPGFFITQQNRYLLEDSQPGKLTPRGSLIIGNTPQGIFGQPEDLLGTMLWLLSPASKFVTGIVVPVDGGFSAFSGV
jgi:NAD(P)-dependent dehydrogenase (short-subunit alcohol dehydrogenase family)